MFLLTSKNTKRAKGKRERAKEERRVIYSLHRAIAAALFVSFVFFVVKIGVAVRLLGSWLARHDKFDGQDLHDFSALIARLAAHGNHAPVRAGT